jgi:hypothetical protein
MAEKNIHEILQWLNNFDKLMGSSKGQSKNEIIEELEEEGIDVKAAVGRILATVQKASANAKNREKLEKVREKRLAFEAAITPERDKYADLPAASIIEKINNYTQSLPSNVSFRDLESMSKIDLITLLEDLEAAKDLEEQKKKSNE